MQMIESMQAINQMLISSNDAVSILSLEDLYQNTKRSLLDCYNEIEALYRLLNDYVETMSELVDAKSGMTQVSRNDIYWNLQSMYKIIDDINSVEISNRLPSESGIGKTEEQKQAMKRNYQKIVNDIWCVCFPTVHTNILNCKNTLERYYTEKIVEYEETDDDYREKAMIFRGTYSGAIEYGLQIRDDIEQVKQDLLSGALGTVIGLLESIIYLTDITYTDGTELIAMLTALTSSDPPLWAQELIKNEQDPYKLLGALLSDPVEVLESMLQGANDAYDENGLAYYIGAAVADILLGKAIAGALKGVKGASAMDEVAEITGKGGNNIINTLTDAQKSRLNSLDNTINDHLTDSDFSGTLRDLQGDPIPNGRGGYYDHAGEMRDSYRSLQKIRAGLEGSLKNPNLSDVDRALLQEGLDKANSYIKRIEELFDPYGGIN